MNLYYYFAGIITGILMTAWGVITASISEIQPTLIITSFFTLIIVLSNIALIYLAKKSFKKEGITD